MEIKVDFLFYLIVSIAIRKQGKFTQRKKGPKNGKIKNRFKKKKKSDIKKEKKRFVTYCTIRNNRKEKKKKNYIKRKRNLRGVYSTQNLG